MQFHITKTYFYFRTIVFCTQVVSLNKLAHIRNELSQEFNVGIITPWELVYQMVFCLKFRFVSFLLNFSHVGMEPWLHVPGYYQYYFRNKCVLLKDTTKHPK